MRNLVPIIFKILSYLLKPPVCIQHPVATRLIALCSLSHSDSDTTWLCLPHMPLPHVDVLLSCLRLQQPHVRPPLMLPPCRGSPHSVPPPALALPMYTQGQHPHSSQVLTSYTTHIHTHNFLTSLSLWYLCTVQDSSVAQSCLCDPMNFSTPGLPIHHQLLELTQTHVYQVSDTIQSSHFLSCPSPPTFNLSQHQGLFKWVSSLQQVAKILEFQLQHQSF